MPRTPTPHLATCETHPERGATRVVEYQVPDPLSATGDETLGPFYLHICSAPDCEIDSRSRAVEQGADERRVLVYEPTVEDLEYITGLAVA